MSTTYRLSIASEFQDFEPELHFACSFLDSLYRVERTATGERVLHYGPNPPAGAIEVPAQILAKLVFLDGEGIHPIAAAIAEFEKQFDRLGFPQPPSMARQEPVSPGISRGSLDYDALGLIFFLLSRVEERGYKGPNNDRYGRFPISASFQYRRLSLEFPAADIAARSLAAALLDTPTPKRNRHYRVHLTHDMDMLRGNHRPSEPVRKALGDVIFRQDLRSAGDRLRYAYFTGEPWKSVCHLMKLSERNGLASRFFLMGPTNDTRDSPYTLREPNTVRRLARMIIERGHKVGFHPGVRTRTDPDEWSRQKKGLEQAIGFDVEEGRHHGLLFDAESTWDIWNDGGMRSDMTLGFPEASGFRSGTCTAHATYSLRHRRTLDLIEYPTSILDFGFFGGRYRDLSVEDALTEAERVIEITRSFDGDLVLLYHTGNLRSPWIDFYHQLLEFI